MIGRTRFTGPGTSRLAVAIIVFLFAPMLHAGGYLWIGAEYDQEGHLYRYDIGTGQINVDCALPQPSEHWNNIAVDGSHVYLGTPTSQYFGIVDSTPIDGTTCNLVTASSYSPSLAGHKEDGAYHAGTNRLWRVTYSGGWLHETEVDGTVVATYAITGIGTGLVGLAWVGDRLYATDWDGTRIGELVFGQTDVTWSEITWTGTPPPGAYGALAYDREDDALYMIAASRHLYTVDLDVAGGTAGATFVVALDSIGYPTGALADGMGWIAADCEDVPVGIALQPLSAALPTGGSLQLEVAASGTGPLTYQWRRGGVPLVDGGSVFGTTTPVLSIDPIEPADAGLYECVVTNVCGSQSSDSVLVTVGGEANAAGYLWLGAEYAGEGSYYRYDVAGNVIDRACSRALPPGGEHWNNMATDGTHLYVGAPNNQLLGRASGSNCDPIADFTYAPALAGRLEDGAYRESSNSLWRVSYNGDLYETTLSGGLLQSYTTTNGLVGLAWVGDALYATSFLNGSIGEVTLAAPAALYTPIPWNGPAPTGTMGALAYDPVTPILYLVTREGLLYTVTVGGGLATATLVEDLNAVGYPESGLADGLGWIGSCAGAASLTISFGADKAKLNWPAVPESTYDVISGSFSRDLSSNIWSGSGGLLATMSCRGNDMGPTVFDTSGLEEPTAGRVSMWLVRACASTWNSVGSANRDADILCP